MTDPTEYTICVNTPGCLPDMDPYVVEGIEGARSAMVEEIMRTAESHPDRTTHDDLGAAQDSAKKLPEGGGVINYCGYAHEASISFPVRSDT